MSVHELESLVKKLTKISLINFAIYTLIAIIIGGDAVNGYAKDGHYFLRLGGYINEVGYSLFLYSKIHTYILITNYALLFLLIIYYYIVKGNKNSSAKSNRLTDKAKYSHKKR
ncbi:MAG: hypothetical protein CVU39_09065 [Chloroflexi bacterium HGW-Chloroflexi-10]|nr:MAG: hypothetical protein CVU39_09065 [Chloroflexi bacterium HGW-Chloroflexi-10]